MKSKLLQRFYSYFAALLLMFSVSSCLSVGGVFDTGMWTGVIATVVVVGLVLWLISKFRGGSGSSGTGSGQI